MQTKEKKGYLLQDFRIFRLCEEHFKNPPAHYHDFHKIILLIRGKGEYNIEGRAYPLSTRSIIFVSAGEIHAPALEPTTPYERIVIYLSPAFLKARSTQADFSRAFLLAQQNSRVMHLAKGRTHDLLYHIVKLEQVARGGGFANELYTEILFLEFLILLTRSMEDHELDLIPAAASDKKILEVLAYIGEHLQEDLSIERITEKLFVSKYHLMRKFKAETGYRLHQYITLKRLLLARNLLEEGQDLTQICYAAGFNDYSTFFRAFKALFHVTPKEWKKAHHISL